MGRYINLGNASFASVRKGLYVDKSEMISFINNTLGTADKLTCVSRPRRFGKSFAAKMLCAYYDRSCDSRKLFEDLKIASAKDFAKNLNQYYVIYLDITWFLSVIEDKKETVKYLQQEVIRELKEVFPGVTEEKRSLPVALSDVTDGQVTSLLSLLMNGMHCFVKKRKRQHCSRSIFSYYGECSRAA